VLTKNRFNVPKGFVITSDAFFEFLGHNNLLDKVKQLTSEINENNFQEKSKEIKNCIYSPFLS
jgi:phosphoenolpyruvate synthase/pyruvate phosphate dikinase